MTFNEIVDWYRDNPQPDNGSAKAVTAMFRVCFSSATKYDYMLKSRPWALGYLSCLQVEEQEKADYAERTLKEMGETDYWSTTL